MTMPDYIILSDLCEMVSGILNCLHLGKQQNEQTWPMVCQKANNMHVY